MSDFKDILKEGLIFIVLVVSIIWLWKYSLLLFVLLSVLSLMALFLWHDSLDVCFFTIVAVFGTVSEILFVKFGVWTYANPTLLGIPIWFPPSFAVAALVGQRLARTVVRVLNKTPGSFNSIFLPFLLSKRIISLIDLS